MADLQRTGTGQLRPPLDALPQAPAGRGKPARGRGQQRVWLGTGRGGLGFIEQRW